MEFFTSVERILSGDNRKLFITLGEKRANVNRETAGMGLDYVMKFE